jgi:glycosyltransferase involved in cell wall biosynthesis
LVTPGEGPLTKKAREFGIDINILPGYDLSGSIIKNIPKYMRSLVSLARLVRHQNVCAILAQNRRLLMATLPVMLLFRIPRVWQVGLGFDSPINRFVNVFCLRFATKVAMESENQARANFSPKAILHASDRIQIIPKGVDLGEEGQSTPDALLPGEKTLNGKLRVGTMASITRRKGIDIFLGAAFNASSVIKEIIIAGEPSCPEDFQYKRELEGFCAKNVDKVPVVFLGWVDDVSVFYKNLDLFILASKNEGISGAVREAMLAGIPVIATDVGGMPDLIEHGKNGLLVPPNDLEALSSAIRQLASDSDLRVSIAQSAYERVTSQYNIRSFAKSYYQLFDELI